MAAAKSTPEIPDTSKPVENKSEEAIKVTVKPTPAPSKDTSDVSAKSELTVHHELNISPIPEVGEKPVEEVVAVPEPEPTNIDAPEPVAEVPKPQEKADAAPLESPEPPSDDAPKTDPELNSNQTDAKLESSDTKAMADKEMQSPRVFDTKQYHLPIDEGAAGGKGKSVMIFLVVLLTLVVGVVVAIDAGWVSLGFDLPFDLIK